MIEKIAISKLKSNPSNPRTIKGERLNSLIKSLKDFPEMMEARPIVANKDNIVLGGNMRLKAAKKAGLKEVPVYRAEEWTEEQEREFIIKDNVGFGEWDWDLLNAEWDKEELEEWGLNLPDEWADDKPEAKEDDFEEPDEVQTDIVLGDLFEIGPHRLLCGDSTNADDVAKLLAGALPELMVTDPPYGVEYDASWRNEAAAKGKIGPKKSTRAIGKVSNDNRANWKEAWALSPAKVCYVWHAQWFTDVVKQSLENCDFELRYLLIWAKNNFAISQGHYHHKHEPCWMGVKKGVTANWIGDRSQTTLWQIDKPMKSETGHSTQKPMECMARPIRNHSGDVYDPFLGSGTTMVAAHQLDRKCYGMEIAPKYCQVILDRMLELDPDLPVKRNGEAYTPYTNYTL